MKNFLRTYIIPLGATALAVLYWLQYKCQGAWWWLVLVGIVLAAHYLFFFKKKA
jgi:hypothetical protein